ncbi:2-amino-4-hydroxy-6-hydroxymethyldihydropteridine diphosphokinase [Oceanicoccus sagamiensis]|uniref:2-amino-4-hydroxy-6-hydroxymethyldihydropteridine pyrophosphokinase n=2 Tax=Oceanicoccus sagamiensis TaxID=716816 RepID=A0A1X9NGK2_9GAMM|nr:2-amino-4-hydroxy-6-hydroxymethyldihydropteridine diphosphokinase [Oceanicoccus sagamiensis]ARN76301.1 2-amino-4-hydroxy-6-hydroxymethyldihydropteridine diphosphokinase [Oceanicoccus sagamiensis]
MQCCYIALGSNLEEPLSQVGRAVEALRALPESAVTAVSPWYQSVAVGPEQPDYINGVVELHTAAEPLTLLTLLQSIENAHERKRVQRWGPRTLDLDILLYADRLIDQPTLTVPHPRMLERNFVLRPLYDIAPALVLANGVPLKEQVAELGMQGLDLVSA